MKSYIAHLSLPSKTRVIVQILATAVIIYGVYLAYDTVPRMLDNMHTISMYPDERLPEVPTWFFFTVLVLAIVPGVFVFLELKKQFEMTDQTCF